MKRIAIAAVTVLAACAVPALISYPLHAAPPAQDVNVVNTRPIPVALGAAIAINGTVFTAPANNPTPVSRIGILSVAAGGREDRQTLYTVPAGKRLIIESETALTQTYGGVKAQVFVIASNSSGGAIFYDMLPQVDRGFWDGQGEMFEGSNAIPMFADAGQPVEARVWLNTSTAPGGGARAEIGFSGYLVDAP